MTKVSWQEHFKNSLEGAEQAFVAGHASHSSEADFLAYCLHENLIPSRDYLEWAKEAHQLPILMDDYFLAHAASAHVYSSVKSVYNWHQHCLPLTTWDGVLLVACLEIPHDFPTHQAVAFLLASPAMMEQTWQFYSGLTEEALAEVQILPELKIDSSPNISLDDLAADLTKGSSSTNSQEIDPMAELLASVGPDPKAALFNESGDLQLKDEELANAGSNPEIELPEAEEEAAGVPEGFFAETVVDAPSLSFTEATIKAETVIDAASPALDSTLTSTVVNAPAPTELKINMETATVSFESLTLQPAPPAPAPPVAKAPPLQAPLADPPRTKGPRSVEPLGPVVSAEEMAKLDNSGLHRAAPASPQPLPPMPKAPVKSTTQHGETAAYLLEKYRKANTENFDKEVKNAFRQLKPYFKKAMLLAIGDKDRVVKPLVWDENFVAQDAPTKEFELKIPSFFRIVATTQKPYHGFVTTNDFNDAFFEAWNQGQIPDHITMVPFMDGDLIVGMLLGIGEKSSYNRQVLQFTEGLAKELAGKVLKPVGAPGAPVTGANKSVA